MTINGEQQEKMSMTIPTITQVQDQKQIPIWEKKFKEKNTKRNG